MGVLIIEFIVSLLALLIFITILNFFPKTKIYTYKVYYAHKTRAGSPYIRQVDAFSATTKGEAHSSATKFRASLMEDKKICKMPEPFVSPAPEVEERNFLGFMIKLIIEKLS